MIRWFSLHPLAANLMMALMIIAGLFALSQVRTEIIPNVEVDWLQVRVPFPGVSSQGIEPGVKRLERSLLALEGVDEVTTTISQGMLQFQVMLSAGIGSKIGVKTDVRALLDTLERPSGADAPSVFQVKIEPAVAALALAGPADYEDLEVFARDIKQRLERFSVVGTVSLYHPQTHGTTIVLNSNALARHNISVAQVSGALRQSRQSAVVGELTEGSRYQLRSVSQDLTAGIGNPVIQRLPDGRTLLLDDVASIVRPDFSQGHKLNGQPAVLLAVKSARGAGLVQVSDQLQEFMIELRKELPSTMEVALWQDTSKYYKARIELLRDNGIFGFALLFMVLAIALHWRLSFWVSLGLPVAFLGGVIALWAGGFSINMVSLFAFILVLGVLVDDAIIVGDSVYEGQQRLVGAPGSGMPTQKALDATLVSSVSQVAKPVVIAAMTTLMMFVPLLFLPGDEGRMLRAIPVVVIAALVFSLIESLLILPAHLRVTPQKIRRSRLWGQERFFWVSQFFQKLIRQNVQNPWLTQAVFIGLCIILFAVMMSGRVQYSFFAKIEGDLAVAMVEMEPGLQQVDLDLALDALERAALELQAEHNASPELPNIKNVLRKYLPEAGDARAGQVALEMSTDGTREIAAEEVASQWQNKVGDIAGARTVSMQTTLNPTRHETAFYLRSQDRTALEVASSHLKTWLERQVGVQSVELEGAKADLQVEFDINAYGASLGLTSLDIASQLRGIVAKEPLFELDTSFGASPVYLRVNTFETVPALSILEKLPLQTRQGIPVQVGDVVVLRKVAKPSSLTRAYGMPSVRVSIKTTSKGAALFADQSWRAQIREVLDKNYPAVEFLAGMYQQEQVDIERYLVTSFFLALVCMYALMAVLLRSYWLPLAVLYAVPFGFVGAVIGHWWLSMPFTLYSLIGVFAVSGIVVNDNLVLIDRYQFLTSKNSTLAPRDLIASAVSQRVRAVVLTTLTTVFGMAPLIFETSIQSQFLKPMAVALAFGISTATCVTLFLVPATLALFAKRRNRLFLDKDTASLHS